MSDLSRHAPYWIGHPGALHPVVCSVAPLSVEHDMGLRVSTSLGGGRRVRRPRTRPLRSWSVDMTRSHPDDVAALMELVTATMGPYQWVTPAAQATNVLSPEASVLKSTLPPLALGGSWPVAGGGVAATSRLNPSRGPVWITPAPVPPSWTQRKVTVSAMLATSATPGARVVLQWLDAAGSQLGGSVPGGYVSGMDGLRRSFATEQVPSGAVSVRVEVQGAEVVARPAVSWTAQPTEWGIGAGGQRVEIESLSETPERAWHTPQAGGRVQTLRMTVIETGPA